MRLSVVIPAHNEERHLPRTLRAVLAAGDALRAQAPAPIADLEVVVADDSSTDATADVARAHGARVVRTEARQIAAARNAGAAAATGDVLLFVDADTAVTPAAVQAALDALRAGAVGGGAPIRFDGHVPLSARLALEVLLVAFRALRLTGGCFLFCRRDAFDAAGGWDAGVYAGEEIMLATALKKQGRFVIIRERVVTSGRKVRAYGALELLGVVARLALAGRASVRTRDRLDFWYAPRREDPGEARALADDSTPPPGTPRPPS